MARATFRGPDLVIVEASEKFIRGLGYNPIGRAARDALPGPEHEPGVAAVARVYATGQAEAIRCRDPRGDWGVLLVEPVMAGGEVIGVTTTYRWQERIPITEPERAALRRWDRLLRLGVGSQLRPRRAVPESHPVPSESPGARPPRG